LKDVGISLKDLVARNLLHFMVAFSMMSMNNYKKLI